MDYCFFNNLNIKSYPEVSPLIDYNKDINPFFPEDDQSFEEYEPLSVQRKDKDEDIELEFLEKRENQICEDSLEINPKISGIMQSNLFDESEAKKELNIEDEFKINLRSTNLTTEKTQNGKIEIKVKEELKERKEIFGIKTQKKEEILPRIDYSIKNFKVTAIKFIKEYGNKLIKDCKFKNELKNLKLFSPSNKYFTGISNIKDNKIFLDFTIGQVFSYPNREFGSDNRLQQDNKKIIEKIKATINNMKKVPKEYQELNNFFDMTFADAILLFYRSDNFMKYKEDQKTKFLDSQFIKVKGFSLLERNSFIEMMRNSYL